MDDDGAIDESEEQAMNQDMIKRKELEDLKAKEEAERIQQEQARLSELQQIEMEVRLRKEQDRRLYAAAPGRATFVLAGVTINQVVFEDDEDEDLAPFSEEQLCEAEAQEQGQYATEGISEEQQEALMQEAEDEEGEEEDGEDEEGDSDEDEEGEEGGDESGEEEGGGAEGEDGKESAASGNNIP